MSSSKKRKKYTAEFKAQVALETIKNRLTVKQIAKKFSVHRNLIYRWKKELIDKLPILFPDQRDSNCDHQVRELFDNRSLETDRPAVEYQWLREKIKSLPLSIKEKLLDPENDLISLDRQCEILGLNPFAIYYHNKDEC